MSKTTQILEDLKNGKCSIEEAQSLLAQMKLKDMKTVTYKVSPKGAISFYGIRKMPITLYRQELDRIVSIANSDEFKQFVIDSKDKLTVKETHDS